MEAKTYMQVSVRDLSFTYDGSYTPVFEHVSFNFDTSWRLGLIGRNGKGKTTLLRLLMGQVKPEGRIDMPLTPVYFPYPVDDPSASTRQVMLSAANAAFRRGEAYPLPPAGEEDVQEWQLICELNQLDVDDSVLDRPFSTLSKGEQTKALLAALFAREDVYPLIDEPTNHLDAHGRALVADYLNRKDGRSSAGGFLLVSHDRAFLNRCIDHVLSLNRSDVWVMQGNYDTWEARLNQQNEYEQGRNEVLRRDIRHLEESARRSAEWAAKAEKGKFHVPPSVSAVVDRGYVGAKAASMMSKATNSLRRKERAIEEKKSLLHNVEKVGELKLTVLQHPKDVLISVVGGKVTYDGRTVCENVNFTLRQGDRLSLTGPNGCGKSSVLKALAGVGGSLSGEIGIAPNLVISYVPQQTDDLTGTMDEFISRSDVDETLFKAILRNMDFTRDLFERPLARMSQGQKKKLLLARSLCIPAHVYIWDEPLNYIDVLSRVQLEGLLTEYAPTMLLVEHDAVFLERVCTSTLALG